MIDISPSVMQALLALIVVGPLLGAVAAPLPAPPGLRGRSPEQAVLRHGVTVTGAVLGAAIVLALGFDRHRPSTMQATTDISWIKALDVRIHLGIDGISLPLLVLTALLTFLCALYSYAKPPQGPSAPSPKAFVALLLLLESGTLAAFAVLDLLLFFLAFEMVLIPMYFLIARWGGEGRQSAAWKFILYTLLGSVVMLLGLLVIGLGSDTFDMVALATDNAPRLSTSMQVTAVLAIGLGLAVKAPMWPLHSWLPDAHTAAPTVGSVLLAGVLLKMGTYGFVRIVLPIAPDGLHTFAPYLAAFAAIGIVYGSLACLALSLPSPDHRLPRTPLRDGPHQSSPDHPSKTPLRDGPHPAARSGDRPAWAPFGSLFPSGTGRARSDLKRLIAYSSVGHMGFVLLGIATMTPTGLNGALFANIAHGLITGLLFFLVGAVKDRLGSTDLDTLSQESGAALYGRAPRLGGLLAFGAVASLGLPGLAGFWGEMLTMFGAFQPAAGLSRPAYLAFMALAGLGTLLTAAYMLVVVRRVCMGGARPTSTGAAAEDGPAPPVLQELPDVRGFEFAAWSPLVVLTVLAGLWPAALLGLSNPAIQQLLAGGAR